METKKKKEHEQVSANIEESELDLKKIWSLMKKLSQKWSNRTTIYPEVEIECANICTTI